MKKEIGFTLIELMITLALAAIVLSIAVPSFSTMIQNNRLISQTNQLVASLNHARSEAIGRGNTVTICSSSDQITCGGGWNTGWITFVDINANGAFDGASDTLLKVNQGLGGNNTLKGTGNTDSISYLSTGFTDLAASASFSLCDTRGNSYGHQVSLSTVGRLSSSTAPVSCTP